MTPNTLSHNPNASFAHEEIHGLGPTLRAHPGDTILSVLETIAPVTLPEDSVLLTDIVFERLVSNVTADTECGRTAAILARSVPQAFHFMKNSVPEIDAFTRTIQASLVKYGFDLAASKTKRAAVNGIIEIINAQAGHEIIAPVNSGPPTVLYQTPHLLDPNRR